MERKIQPRKPIEALTEDIVSAFFGSGIPRVEALSLGIVGGATPVLEARHALSESLEDTLFALAILGDDRTVRATYVAGRRVWGALRLGAQ